ncbi:MAG: hypothetical protein ACRBBZ_06580 [Nitrosopumilus sp.]
MTESVDIFGQINSADLILNDIWIEPENPKAGESVSVHGSLYNAGVVSSGKVSDAVTVGYIVNGDLVKIDLLDNILPGMENGVEIASGPIFDALSESYIVTVIVNYHDTLSHLRDNPENNIVQKRFQISNAIPSVVAYDLHQKYDIKTNKQQIIIQGELTNIFQEKLNSQKIILDIGNVKKSVTTDINGTFLFVTSIPFNDEPVKVSVHAENDFTFPESSKMILPIKMTNDQSALAIDATSSTNNFKNSSLELVIFQDSYEKEFKKLSFDKLDVQSMLVHDSLLTVLPANHEYIVEIYLEGRFLDAFQDNFNENIVMKKEISISESAEIRFRVTDEMGEPQDNVVVNNWVYSATTNEDGFTDWIKVLPTVITNEPYAAKATFSDGNVVWSDSFFVDSGEKKVVEITQKRDEK